MNFKKWFPHIVALLLTALFIVPQPVWAAPVSSIDSASRAVLGSSKTTISYQGYLVDGDGNPVNAATLAMVFKLYNVENGGTALWEELQSVAVSNGLFSVLLGSVTPISTDLLANNDDLWLGITIGSDTEMIPREKITSTPYALLSNVPDGSITGAKLASGSVGTATLATDAVTSAKIKDGEISSSDVKDNSLSADDLATGSVGTDEVINSSLTASDLAPDSVGTSEVINNSLTASDLAPDSVGVSELAADSVGTSEVINNSLTANDLAPNSVGTSEVDDDSLTASDLAPNSVGSSELAADSVKADELDPTAFNNLVIKTFDFQLGCRNDYGNGHAGCERRYNFPSAFPNKTLFVTASIHLAGNETFWHWIPAGVYNVNKSGFDLGFVTYTDAGSVGWYNQWNTKVVGYAVGY